MMLQSQLPFMPPSSWEETHDKDISCLELALPSHDFVAPAAESYSFGAGGGGDCNNVKMISVAWDSVHGSSSCLGHGFVDKTDDDMSVVNEDVSLNSAAHQTEYIAAGADHGDQFNDHYASLGSEDESTWPPPKDALINSGAHYNSHDRRSMSVALNLSREYPVEAAAIRETTTTTSIPSPSKCPSPKDLHRWPPKIAAKNAKAKDSSCHEDHRALNYGVLTGSRNTPRVCVDCNTTKTPLWRSGPHGPKSLCNACGIRYRKARRALSAFGSAGHIAAYKSRMPKRKYQQQQVDQDEEYKFVHYKKRSRMSIPSRKSIKNTNLKFTAKANQRSFQRVFAEDEKEAAVLLMALSCGQLVNR